MRKAVIAVAGVAILAAGGWSAVWYAGRGEIETRVTAEVDRLRAAGYQIDYTGGAVGGYPIAWEARYEDVRIADPVGRTMSLPWLTARAGVEDPGRVSFHFPEAFSATVPMPPSVAENIEDGGQTDPVILTIDVEADGLVVRSSAPDGASTAMDAEATALLIVSGGETQPVSGAFELTGLDGNFSIPTSPGVGQAKGRAVVKQLDYAITQLDPSGMRTTSEGISQDLSFTASSDLLTREDWLRFASGENRGATVELSWQSGETVSQIKVDGSSGSDADTELGLDEQGSDLDVTTAADAPERSLDGVARQMSGTSGGLFRVADGRIEVRLSAETNRIALEPVDEAAPIRGQITLDSLETVYVAPIVPSEEMTEFNIRVAAQGLEVDESLWTLVDPGEMLERGRADFIVEVGGTGRLVGAAEGEPQPTGRDAIELGNVEITVAEVSALGARLEADGAVEFLQPLNLPTGRITVRTRNLIDLAQRFQALGVIDEQMFQTVSLMATVYTREGESAEERVSEIVFADSGITINDLPVR